MYAVMYIRAARARAGVKGDPAAAPAGGPAPSGAEKARSAGHTGGLPTGRSGEKSDADQEMGARRSPMERTTW